MTPNNPMTEGEALAEWVSAGGSHHGPNVETVTMPLADYVRFRAALTAHTAASGGEVVAWQERYFDTYTGEWSQWRYCAKYIYEAHLNCRVPEIEARVLYTAPPASVPVAELVALASDLEAEAELANRWAADESNDYEIQVRNAGQALAYRDAIERIGELTALAQKGDARGQG